MPASALMAKGAVDEAQKELEFIKANATSQDELKFADDGLAAIGAGRLAQQAGDWKRYTATRQGFAFSYPKDWKIDTSGTDIVLSSPAKDFKVSLYGGVIKPRQKEDSWRKASPVKFLGKVVNSGPAQVPGFDATAFFWEENADSTASGSDVVKNLELLLVAQSEEKNKESKDRKVVHVKAGPMDSPDMKLLDTLLSQVRFL